MGNLQFTATQLLTQYSCIISQLDRLLTGLCKEPWDHVINSEMLLQDQDEQIIEMNSGWICCTVRGDLVRILGELAAKKRPGTLPLRPCDDQDRGLG